MAFLRVITPGNPVNEYVIDEGTTIGAFVNANGINLNGRAIVLNGVDATLDTQINGDSQLLLVAAVKGGN